MSMTDLFSFHVFFKSVNFYNFLRFISHYIVQPTSHTLTQHDLMIYFYYSLHSIRLDDALSRY